MNKDIDRLKSIEIENKIWIIYLVIIGLAFWANEFEKQYFFYHHVQAKENYRYLTIFIFIVAVCIYYYFFQDSYQELINLKFSDQKNKRFFTEANFVASTLIFVAGLILLMIAIFDTEITTEIALT